MTDLTVRDSLIEPAALQDLATITNLLRKASGEAYRIGYGPHARSPLEALLDTSPREFRSEDLDTEALELAANITSLRDQALAMVLEYGVDLGEGADGDPTGEDPGVLLRRAEELTRAHRIYEFPPGMTGLVIGLIDTIREHCRE